MAVVDVPASAPSGGPAAARWSTRYRGWLLVAAVLAVVVAEAPLLNGRGAVAAAADALAGAMFLAVAMTAASRPATVRLAAAAALTALAWLAANLAGPLVYLYRPLLVHTVLAYPDGRLRGPPSRLAAGFAWLGAVVLPVGADPISTSALGALVAAAGVAAWLRGPVTRRPAARVSVRAATVCGVALAGPALVRLGQPISPAADALAAGQAVLVAIAGAVLLAAVVLDTGGPARLADAVVELSEVGSPRLDAVLAALRTGSGDDASLVGADPATRAVLSTVADLLDDNVRLHAALAAQVGDVRRSRRRLVEVVDVERGRLQRRLAAGPQRHLDHLDTTLAALRGAVEGTAGAAALDLVQRARDEVVATHDDLARLGHGLPPQQLTDGGLTVALRDLAQRQPVATIVHAQDARLPATVEATAWFVCAEASANVAKHARARTMTVEVARDGREVVVTVTDDGVGGARMVPGGGLAGLADRVDAVAGRLELCDRPGGGTRLQVRLPWT